MCQLKWGPKQIERIKYTPCYKNTLYEIQIICSNSGKTILKGEKVINSLFSIQNKYLFLFCIIIEKSYLIFFIEKLIYKLIAKYRGNISNTKSCGINLKK